MFRPRTFARLARALRACSVALILACCSWPLARAADTAAPTDKLPDGVRVARIEAFPTSIELANRFDYRQLLITGRLESGESVDLTRMATLRQPARVVKVGPRGLVSPVSDGEEQLVFEFAGQSLNVPVKVTGFSVERPISFVRDVQPVFSKMGCNAGTCHGARNGKNGFKLSLRGYDPLYDHRAFTDDSAARRLNRAAPDQSLMLLKATGSVPHVGGVRTRVDEPYYEMVRQWIASGAKLDLGGSRVTSIDILPKNPILPRALMKQQVVVMATYSDGSVRDVTREAFIESGNIEVIEAGEGGVLTMLRRGEAPVLVRYEGNYAATTIVVMGDRSGFVWNNPARNNYIDELVHKKLQRVKVLPSGPATDAEFIRRVFIDVTGLPPSAEEVRAFLADPRDTKTKRDDLIDRLVGGREYVEHWTNKWADMLQVNRKFLGEEGSVALRNWIKNEVASNRPYDQFAKDILTARGSTFENPPAAYYKTLREPPALMENTTHLFLAVRFNCNKCHDHPFERWTQDQYYHLAAYFAQVEMKEDPSFAGQRIGGSAVEGAKPLVEVVFDKNSGEVTHDRTGQVTPPAFPYSHPDLAATGASRREQLAHWITSPKNQYFARSYVNRLWGYLFGVGIIEPIDDIRAGNPPTNPELLDALEKDFVASGFNVQHMLKTICKSQTYQLSVATSQWNEDDGINYSHSLPRRLPAEVLFDAIHVATGSTPRIPGAPPGFRAAELPDAGVSIPFLDDFGRPVRESSCECERSTSMVLGPIMKLVNGPTVADAINDPDNALTKLVAQQADDRKLIEEVFLRFVARPPSDSELKLGLDAIASAGEEHQTLLAKLDEYRLTVPARQAQWEKSMLAQPVWTVLDPSEFKSQAGAMFKKGDDKSVLVSGPQGKDTYTVVVPTELTKITGLKLEVLPDPSLPTGGPGRALNGNFVLNELQVTASSKADPSQVTPVGFQNAIADFSQASFDPRQAVDGNEATGWAIAPESNKPHFAIFETKADVGVDGGSVLTITMSHQFDATHLIGKFRLSATNSPRPLRPAQLPADLGQALSSPAEQRTDAQKALIAARFRETDKELQQLELQERKSAEQLKNKRLSGVQDLAWALINNPSFLFNR